MQGGWPDFRVLVFNITANPGSSHSSSSWKVPTGGTDGSTPSSNAISASSSSSPFSDVTPFSTLSSYSSNSSSSPIPGKLALGNGMAAVLHAAGSFLRFLGHKDGDKGSRRLRKNKEKFKKSKDLKIINCPETRILSISTNGGLTSFFFARISSVLRGGWSKLKSQDALPTMLAAVLPPS